MGADTTDAMVGSEFTAPVPFWGRRGYPYGDYQRKWWRALRGLPTFLHCERALRGLLSVPRRAAPPPEPGERRRSLRTPKTQKSRESTKILGSQWSSASWAYLLPAPFVIVTISMFST